MPPAWTASEPKEGEDYGIDLTVGIANDGHVTGRNAHVQVKGLETTPSGKARPRVRLKRTTVMFWRELADVAALIVVAVDSDRVWFCHAFDDALDAAVTRSTGRAFSFALQDRHETTWNDLFARLDRLSYRRWWGSHRSAPVGILCPNERLLDHFDVQLRDCLPREVVFTTRNDSSAQLAFSECEGRPTLVDAALPTKHLHFAIPISAGDMSGVIAAMLAAIGMPNLGASVLVAAAPQIGPSPADPIRLKAAFMSLCSPAEQAHILRVATDRGFPWAADWMGDLFVQPSPFPFSAAEVERAFACLPAEHVTAATLFRQAQIIGRIGDSHRAGELLARAIANGLPGDSLERYSLAMFHELMGDLADAEREFQLAGKQGQPSADIACDLFRLAVKKGDFEAAERLFPTALPKDPILWSRALMCVVAFLYARSFEIYAHDSDGGEKLDAYESEETTDEVFAKLVNDGKPADEKAEAAFSLALLQAVRTNRAHWFAASLVWGERASVDEEVLQAIAEYASSLHGGDVVRLAVTAM